jgi:hypothetical protein
MSDTTTISPLRQRMTEDMAARKLNPHTQAHPAAGSSASRVYLFDLLLTQPASRASFRAICSI